LNTIRRKEGNVARAVSPPRAARLSPWRFAAAAVVGILIGIGGYATAYAQVPSYFGEDPRTCANCHAMQTQFDSWRKGPHQNVATCNDCHLPHDSVGAKYMTKAEDGVVHAYKFTLNNYPNNIVIRDKNLRIANQACLECHDQMTDQMRITMGATQEMSCVRCHAQVGHT
jgi:cytochrome c nitrite reductase small subunit